MESCQAEYDPYGSKRCVLLKHHDGPHRAEWTAAMTFDYDYRDPRTADWLD